MSVYEVTNDGWYDLGFFLGVPISLGGSGGGTVRARARLGACSRR